MSYYLVMRGPLGVGKTTISAALARSIHATVVSIDEIADKEWDGGSVRLYLAANGIVAEKARRAFAHGIPVVLDGCFYWKTQIEDLTRRLPYPHVVFTLMAPLPVCTARDSGRRVSFGAEAVEQVYRKVTRFEYGIRIDATEDIPTIVHEIRTHLPPGGIRLRAR